MAFQAGAIVSQMTLDRSKFSASIKAVQKQTRTLGGWVKKNSAQFKRMGMAIAAMGATALLVFKKMVKQYVEVGDMVHKMALRTGFAAETLSELAYAADISGADLTMLEKGVKKMSKTIVDASYGLETYLRVFRSLGLEIDDLLAMSPEEQFLKIGSAIAEMESDTLRTAAAVDVFGRSGTMLLPLFKEGAEGIAKLREEARTLGIIFDEEAAAKAAKLKDAQTALKGSVQGLSIAILNDLIPVLTDVTKEFTNWFVNSRKGAATWAEALVNFFKIIAQGIQGMMLAFHEFQRTVFEGGELITKVMRIQLELWGKIIGLLAMISPAGSNIRKMYGELGKALLALQYIGEGYHEEQEKQIDIMTDIISGFEGFFAVLDKVKTKIIETKEEARGFGTVLAESVLPPARDITGVLEQAQAEFAKTGAVAVVGGKMTEGAMTKQEAALHGVATAYEGGLGSIMSAIQMVTMGEFLKSLATSKMPFLAKLLMTGVVVGLIKAVFGKIMSVAAPKKFARGGRMEEGEPGIVGERGQELFVPDTAGTIVPMRERAPAALGARAVITLAPVYYLSSLDPQTARDVAREQIGPELLDMLETKILLPEFQRALGIK